MHKLKISNRLLLISSLLIIIALPLASSASLLNPAEDMKPPTMEVKIPGMAPFSDVSDSGKNLSSSWIAEYIVGIYNYGIGIIGIVAMIMIAYGGVLWVVSAGNPGKVKEAKDHITGALTGLALGLGSYMLLSMINTDLVTFKNISIPTVQDPAPDPADFSSSGGELTGPYVAGKASFISDVPNYDAWIRDAAKANGIDCSLVKAVMMAESNGNAAAISPKGAKGLMQIMDKTFQGLGVGNNPLDPETSIKAGAKYLSQLKSVACNGSSSGIPCTTSDLQYIIAAYNGGPKANRQSISCLTPSQTFWQCTANGGYAETRNYVKKVLANQKKINEENLGCK